jgi:hypothetical protein
MTEVISPGAIVSSVKILGEIVRRRYTLAYRKAKKELQESTERQQFEKIYVPLRVMLLDIHVTTAQGIRYPCFSWRWRRAIKFLKDGYYKIAFFALFDNGKSELSGEAEYGALFSLDDVKKILTKNPHLVSARLMHLYQLADRASYEIGKHDYHELLPEDLKLIDYIYERYEKLSRRFAR